MPHVFDPSRYGPAIAKLIAADRLSPLGPGTPDEAARSLLATLDLDQAVSPRSIRDRDMARACLAGLWLEHNCLDESHTISQDIDTPTGSYWHGLMHRREPDASNAAYWFRRVGDHPIFADLAEEARTLGLQGKSGRWDPFAFIDLCEKHRDTESPEEETLRRVQRREWELLFDFCYRAAVDIP
jgi:hypothetical protein